MIIKQEVILYLKSRDKDLETLIDKYGDLSYESKRNVFEDVVKNIIGQMLSKKVSDVIEKRVVGLCEKYSVVFSYKNSEN